MVGALGGWVMGFHDLAGPTASLLLTLYGGGLVVLVVRVAFFGGR